MRAARTTAADLPAFLAVSCRRRQGPRAFDPFALGRRMHRLPQIAAPLHIEPEIRAVAEHAGENERGRRGDVAAIVAQLVDVLALQS